MNSELQNTNPTASQPKPAYGDEISIIDIVRVLLRGKKLIIGITAVTCLSS